jgi:Tol biopolymer transport system component
MKKGNWVVIGAAAAVALVGALWFYNMVQLPPDGAPEKESKLYTNPQAAEIKGYDGQVMEPALSADGKYIFFNNENSAKLIKLYYAQRTGKLSFKFMGELKGANDGQLSAAPTLDSKGRIYFTTDRVYPDTFQSTFAANFNGKGVTEPKPVEGDITLKAPGIINMDVGVSPDGRALYVSRARFAVVGSMPQEADMVIARRDGNEFVVDTESADLLKNVNTAALEYAPAVTSDGKELYFTRASGKENLRIMVATRASAKEPFGIPQALTALEGFVEAPTLSADRKEMFFHKRVDGKFQLFRAERSGK